MVESQLAYAALTEIKKLPADSPQRADRLPAAIVTCIPRAAGIGATAVGILELCDRCVDIVNHYCFRLGGVRGAGNGHRAVGGLQLPGQPCELTDPADRASVEQSMNQLTAMGSVDPARGAEIWGRIHESSNPAH